MRISEKHGVNPSLMVCPVCGKDSGVALHGRLPDDKEAPRRMMDLGPCEKCCEDLETWKQQGFIFIVVEKEQHPFWPWFNSLHVIKFEKAEQLLSAEHRKHGMCFVSPETAEAIGLPIKKASCAANTDAKESEDL